MRSRKPLFKPGDICVCTYTLRKGGVKHKDTIVRITSVKLNKLTTVYGYDRWYSYRCYNITLDRYDELGDHILKFDKKQTRKFKLSKLLK